MSKSLFFLLASAFLFSDSEAQFAPAAGTPGTTAIHRDSSVFIDWASDVTITRGPQDISNPSLGLASAGEPAYALGKAGDNPTVSLGDGGEALFYFEHSLRNGPGWDFAVFENGLNNTFLEFAFVEVSSDGIIFTRFPATSLADTSQAESAFLETNPELVNNLAGKYRSGFGTPFDLEELEGTEGLDINHITHIRLVDVVGSKQSQFATYDQNGRAVMDPWPTPFPSSGFDLDALGVIHNNNPNSTKSSKRFSLLVFPQPAKDELFIRFDEASSEAVAYLFDLGGRIVMQNSFHFAEGNARLGVGSIPRGIYTLRIDTASESFRIKVVLQ